MKASSGVIGHRKTMHNLELRVDTIVSASHQNVYIRIQDVRRSILGREGCQEGKAQEGQNFALVGSVIKLLGGKYGGETGIRTLDTLRYTRFPSVRLQPLGHLSAATATCSNLSHIKHVSSMGSAAGVTLRERRLN